MGKKILMLSIMLLGSMAIVFGQQQGQFSQYMLNYYMINPAVSGTEDFIDIKLGYRNQWSGIDGAPKNYYLSAHAPIGKLHGAHYGKRANKQMLSHSSIGGMFNGQKLGQLGRTSGYASYAYHLPLDSKHFLSMGIMAGAVQYTLDATFGSSQDMSDPSINSSNFSKTVPDGNIGVWFYSEDYFAGLSVSQIFGSRIDNITITSDTKASLDRHVYFAGGYGIKLNKWTKVIPSTLMKYSNNVFTADLNCKLKYDNKLWGGISYRYQDAFVVLAGVLIAKQVELGMSYDVTSSSLKNYSGATYELVLGYRFNQIEDIVSPSQFW